MKTNFILIAAFFFISVTSCKKKGCTDPLATNFSEDAKKNDNSCIYPPDSSIATLCEGYTSSFVIETPNKGTINFVNKINSNFSITGTSIANVNANWTILAQQTYSVSFQLGAPLLLGSNVFHPYQAANGAITYKDDADTLSSFTYVLMDSLIINVTEAIEDVNSGYYKPIEATFSGKYKYWGYTASGQTDTAMVNITGSFNLCGVIE